MAKILITDFFGTLIPNDAVTADQRYGDHKDIYDQNYQMNMMDNEKIEYAINKMNIHTARSITPFLKDGNYLVIVTSADTHDSADFVYQRLVSEIIKYSANYSKQISLFFKSESGGQDVIQNLKKIANIYKKGNNLYAKDYNGYKFNIIKSKERVFDFLNITSKDELYAIGDDFTNISMFSKCMQLGGKVSIVKYYPSSITNDTTDKIITETAERDAKLKKEKFILENFPEINNKSDYCAAIKEINFGELRYFRKEFRNYFQQKRVEYYKLLNEKSFDIIGEMTKNELFLMILIYNSMIAQYKKNDRINPEEWFGKVDMYPTFQEYYSKVLSIH